MSGVLHVAAYFGATVLIGIALVFVHDFIERGLNNRRARLAEETNHAQ